MGSRKPYVRPFFGVLVLTAITVGIYWWVYLFRVLRNLRESVQYEDGDFSAVKARTIIALCLCLIIVVPAVCIPIMIPNTLKQIEYAHKLQRSSPWRRRISEPKLSKAGSVADQVLGFTIAGIGVGLYAAMVLALSDTQKRLGMKALDTGGAWFLMGILIVLQVVDKFGLVMVLGAWLCHLLLIYTVVNHSNRIFRFLDSASTEPDTEAPPESPLLQYLRTKVKDAVCLAYASERHWSCICGQGNPLNEREESKSCASCDRNRDFVLANYTQGALRKSMRKDAAAKGAEAQSNVAATALGVGAILLFATGCASVTSEPSGADVYLSNYHGCKRVGQTPYKCSYLGPATFAVRWADGTCSERGRFRDPLPFRIAQSLHFDKNAPKGPPFEGHAHPNWARVTINSEPQGANLYEDGKFVGKTPYQREWQLEDQHYASGEMLLPGFTVVYPGYLAAKAKVQLVIEPGWRPDPYDSFDTYVHGRRFEFHRLFVLQSDPNAPRTAQQPQQININTAQPDSDLDVINKGLDAIIKLRAISPAR